MEFESDTYVAQKAAQDDASKIIADAVLISGKSQTLQTKVIVPAGTVATDTILLGFLPGGATVIPGNCTKTIPLAAGANPVDIGFASDPTAIAAAVDVNTAGSAVINSIVPSIKNTTRQVIVATLSGTLTATRELYFNFNYAFAE